MFSNASLSGNGTGARGKDMAAGGAGNVCSDLSDKVRIMKWMIYEQGRKERQDNIAITDMGLSERFKSVS